MFGTMADGTRSTAVRPRREPGITDRLRIVWHLRNYLRWLVWVCHAHQYIVVRQQLGRNVEMHADL